MISTAALSFCGLFTSCTHDFDDSGYSSAEKSVISTYQEAFVTAFGQPAPTQTWGFGPSTKASTRGTRADLYGFSLPTNPTFKDKDDIEDDEPTISGVYNNVTDATTAGVTVVDAKNKQNFNVESNKSYAIDSKSTLNNLGNVSNTVIYITEDMAFNMSLNQNASNTIVVTSGKTVTVNSTNQYQTYYVADGAILNFPYDISVERGFRIFMQSGSTVNAQNITIKSINSVSSIANYGGTLNVGTAQNKKTLTLENGAIVWNEGTINVYDKLYFNNQSSKLYNAQNDTIRVGSLALPNNYNLLVNDGTLISNGAISLENNSPELVNNGELSGTSLTLKSGAKFHNTGNTTITGKTHIANDQCEWKNEGTFTTEDFEVSDYAKKVWNCCKMIVHKTNDTGVFKIYGEFVLDRGASIVTDNVDWVNKSNVYMNGLSLFRVKETLDSDNKDTECGFHAMADEWAVLKAKSIVQRDNKNEQLRMAYFGNLWVDADSHFQIWYKDAPSNTNQPNYKFYGNAKFGHEGDEGCPVIPVDDTKNCTPGYNTTGGGGGGGGGETTTPKIRIICEDLSARNESAGNSDWDFNDVVFDVELAENNITAIVTLLAAGGTLPLTVGWEGDDIDDETYQNYEVHKKFADYNTDKSISTTSMINTGSTGEKYTFRDCNKAYIALPVKQEWINQAASSDPEDILKAVALNIPVKVYKLVGAVRTWVPMEAITGEPAAKIAVGTDYNWCDERTDIRNNFKGSNRNNEYPLFNMFVKGIISESGWYTRTTLTNDEVDSYLNN